MKVVNATKGWKREFITYGHHYEFCTVLYYEVSDDNMKTGDFMVARTDNGREFISIHKMDHYMEAHDYELQCELNPSSIAYHKFLWSNVCERDRKVREDIHRRVEWKRKLVEGTLE